MRHIQRKATPNNQEIPSKLFGVALLCCYSRKIYAYELGYAFMNSPRLHFKSSAESDQGAGASSL